jgi:bifunctional enzyme CysN/CysC
MARSLFGPEEFMEIHVDVPLEIAEQRDPKGLYRKARKGELPNFTGIDSAYEPPEKPELLLHTGEMSVPQCARVVLEALDMPD